MPGRGRGEPPSLPSLTGNSKTSWETPVMQTRRGVHAPALPGEVRGKGEALGVQGDAPSPLPPAPRTY